MNTIAAISTPPAPGGIAMIRMSGDRAIEIADVVFSAANHTKVTEMRGYTCAYGSISEGGERLDDVVLTVFRAPHSYTGEDVVEITCHGGIYLTKRILALLLQHGAALAGAGEFTKRAFLNDKLSLSQAEAVMELIAADGESALRQARLAKDGFLGSQMHAISETLVELIAAIAYWLDDAEECPPELERETLYAQITGLSARLAAISANYQNGRVLREGIRTVLLGRPNAGKSAVMNWLCGMQRSIVTDIAGTTRDVITEQVKIGEFTLLLYDTAGLRKTDDQIEAIGISQAYQALETADLVLYVVDAAAGMTEEDIENLRSLGAAKTLLLWNKTDLTDANAPKMDMPVVSCAALHEQTHEKIEDALRALFGGVVDQSLPSVINERQNLLLQAARQSLDAAAVLVTDGAPLDILSFDLETAAQKLRELEGGDVTDDVIDTVFSRFCVGK